MEVSQTVALSQVKGTTQVPVAGPSIPWRIEVGNTLVVDSGANQESVEVLQVNPAASPATFTAAFAKSHDRGAAISLGVGAGQFDGVEITRDGALWVSSWADSSVYQYVNGQGTRSIKGVPSPADIGYDARRNRLLIPIFTGNRVEIWQLQ